jgi:hypothetical protein
MITRATWFVAGAVAGAVGASYTRRKVKAVAEQMTPVNVARGVAGRARSRGQDLMEAMKEGRLAMRAKEDQLRAGRDAEGLAIAPAAQIIVLSDVRQLEQLTRAVTREASDAAHSPRDLRRQADHPSGRRRRSRR